LPTNIKIQIQGVLVPTRYRKSQAYIYLGNILIHLILHISLEQNHLYCHDPGLLYLPWHDLDHNHHDYNQFLSALPQALLMQPRLQWRCRKLWMYTKGCKLS